MDLYMLTTTDNPYSPVTHYDDWLAWDLAHYDSNSLLARVVVTSPELSEADQQLAIEDAIDEIVTENVSGVHTKVRADTVPAQAA
jgi:hypothetical protein